MATERENEASPSDEKVTQSIKEERNNQDKRKYSITPSFLEDDGLPADEEVTRDMETEDQKISEEDFEDLSSDKEEDTTEGEITDTHTSD